VYFNAIRSERVRVHLYFWIDRGVLRAECIGAEVSLTGQEWQKHTIVSSPEAPCILGIDCLRRGYFKDPRG